MYVSGFVTPVPEGNKDAYIALAKTAADVFKEHGATEVVEAWEDMVEDGKHTDFRRAVGAEAGEKIVFSWTVWPDKATAEQAFAKMMQDERMNTAEMPFDGKRMIWGGFAPVFTLGRGE